MGGPVALTSAGGWAGGPPLAALTEVGAPSFHSFFVKGWDATNPGPAFQPTHKPKRIGLRFYCNDCSPPFAKSAKDGAPTAFARVRRWATRPSRFSRRFMPN
jgi:hypothetical protein